MTTVAEALQRRLGEARSRIGDLVLEPSVRQVGVVESVGSGVATISGLAGTRLDEVLLLPGEARATAVSLDRDRIGAVLL
ncbi:hypothetical protein, partial [Escherichia coli]|uniref:hypothetical protein n=1 Tax=Escherichia coli TaxID=562 RepID=UPI0018305E83|nr:F0F1 ATP synthase subunit alpha [Escherichia coli]